MEPRKAYLKIEYNQKDISITLNKFLKSFTYTDVASGASDDITIQLVDLDKRWIGKWLPEKGDEITAKIVVENWGKQGKKQVFPCGKFTIDDYSYSGRPLVASIGAISVPAMEEFRVTKHSKSWASATLKMIANEIAKRSNIKLVYDADEIKLGKIEQSEQTDSEFLSKTCEQYGIAMKVYAKKIVLFDEERYEKKKTVATIHEADMEKWSYNTTLTKVYTGAEISYTDAGCKKETKVTVGSGKRILKINEKFENTKEAETKAIVKLNNENKKETTMKINMRANPAIIASSTVKIEGLKKLDGKYYVEEVKHSLGNGYLMQLNLRKIQPRIKQNTVKNNLANTKKDNKQQFYKKAGRKPTKTENYIVKKGDNLWDIAKKFYGSGIDEKKIYEANKEKIEKIAKEHGKENSKNGHWIWEGTEIIIPEVEEKEE